VEVAQEAEAVKEAVRVARVVEGVQEEEEGKAARANAIRAALGFLRQVRKGIFKTLFKAEGPVVLEATVGMEDREVLVARAAVPLRL